MVLRFVPKKVVGNTAWLWISVRERLWPLFYRAPELAVGAPHLIVGPFRQELEAILKGGIFEYLSFVEQNERRALSLGYRPTMVSFGRAESVKTLASSLFQETPTEVSDRLENSIIGLSKLIWSLRSLLKPRYAIGGILRKYLYSELTVIERCWRELVGSDFIPFIPNARTNKSIPEEVLRALATNILYDMDQIRRFMHEVRHDPRAVDILSGVKYSPIMNIHGIRFDRNLRPTDIMDRLASAHPRFRRGLKAEIFEEAAMRAQMVLACKIQFSQGRGSYELGKASDAAGVNARMLILPWDLSNSGDN